MVTGDLIVKQAKNGILHMSCHHHMVVTMLCWWSQPPFKLDGLNHPHSSVRPQKLPMMGHHITPSSSLEHTKDMLSYNTIKGEMAQNCFIPPVLASCNIYWRCMQTISLVQQQVDHISNSVMFGIHDVFPPSEDDKEDPISLQKLLKGKREGGQCKGDSWYDIQWSRKDNLVGSRKRL